PATANAAKPITAPNLIPRVFISFPSCCSPPHSRRAAAISGVQKLLPGRESEGGSKVAAGTTNQEAVETFTITAAGTWQRVNIGLAIYSPPNDFPSCSRHCLAGIRRPARGRLRRGSERGRSARLSHGVDGRGVGSRRGDPVHAGPRRHRAP